MDGSKELIINHTFLGMAAATCYVTALLKAGDHIVSDERVRNTHIFIFK